MEIDTDSRDESGDESESGEESNFTEELPETERRFMTFNPPARNHNNREEEESDEDEIGLIAERQFIEENSIENREQLNHSIEDLPPQQPAEGQNVEADLNVIQPHPAIRFDKTLELY